MPAGMNPYITAGLVLVGASVIAVTPIAPPPTAAGYRVVAADVSLAAATCTTTQGEVCGGADAPATYPAITARNVLNVPANLLNAILSIPAAELAGMNLLAKSLEETGSLLVWSPTNAFGFDRADPDKLRAIYDLLIPFPALSSVIGAQAVVWAQANFPVNAGCAAVPGACPDPHAILSELLKVPTRQLYKGYTFPSKVNPFDGSSVDYPDGYVQLDPNAPGKAFLASLLATPTGPQTFTLGEVGATFTRLGKALFNSFYPFVQNSEYYNPDETGLAYVFRALSPILCGNCDRDPTDGYAGVYQPKYLYGNYHPHFPPVTAKTTTEQTVESTTTGDTPVDPGSSMKATAARGTGTVAERPTTLARRTPKSTSEPSGPKHHKPGGGLAAAVKSLRDNVTASVAKMNDNAANKKDAAATRKVAVSAKKASSSARSAKAGSADSSS